MYLWDIDEKSFAGCFLIQKGVIILGLGFTIIHQKNSSPYPVCVCALDVDNVKGLRSGTWNSIHVIEVRDRPSSDEFQYRLTTTVIVSMSLAKCELHLCL